MFGTIISVIKAGIQVVGLVAGVVDQISRERAVEQAKKAKAREEMAKQYQNASKNAGHEKK